MAQLPLQEAFALAIQHHQAGRLREAEQLYRQILAVQPQHDGALHLMGVLAAQVGQTAVAADLIRQSIAINPRNPQAHSNLGNVLKESGRLNDAIAAYQHAIALNPNSFEALYNLGNALKDKGQLDAAIAAYGQAIAINPDFPDAHNNLGIVLTAAGHMAEAIAACRRAISLKPRYPEAYNNLANALRENGQLEDAIAAFRQAIAINPTFPEAHNNLGNALKDKGHIDEAIAAFRQAVALKPEYTEADSNLVYTLHFHPGWDAKTLYQEHLRWNQRHAKPLEELIQPHHNDRSPDRRLKIAYLSPDFRNHPVGRFLLPLLAAHDHSQFEIFAYSQVSKPGTLTPQLHAHTDHWREIVGLTDEQTAQLIRDDHIDILVDLTMHMARNRLLVFARKPAPVQVTYLAYCSTTGLSAIDYRLSDPYLNPPGVDESIYTEQTLRLPETYWCYQPGMATSEPGPVPALANGHITFGSLNNFCKVSPPGLSAWARLVLSVPGSQLLIHTHEGSHRQEILDRLQHHGVAPQRVEFAALLPVAKYFDLYHQIDIALDTFPYGGGTTSCDALWMGVPVVSLAGNTAVGRGGLSILSNLGLPELVARSEDQYVQIARDLAGDLPRLAHLRSTLRQRMQQSPLTDAPRFARNVEAAYRQMWRRWCAAAPAAPTLQ